MVLVHQLRALFIKNLTLYWRQKIALIFICLFPVALIAFVAILQVAVDNLNINNGEKELIHPPPEPLNIFQGLNETELNNDYFFNYFYALPSSPELCSQKSFCIGELTSNGTGSGLLSTLVPLQYNWTFSNGTRVTVPYFFIQNSTDQVERDLLDMQSILNEHIEQYKTNTTLKYLLPDGVVIFDAADLSMPVSINLSYRIMYNDYSLYQRLPTSTVQYRLMTYVHTIFDLWSIFFNPAARPSVVLSKVMPFVNTEAELRVIDVAGIALFPFAVSFLLPLYLYRLVLEKQTKLRVMMRIMGLNNSSYWLVNYILDFALYCVVALLFSAVEIATSVKFFVQSAPHIIFLLFFLWGLAQISFAYFLSAVINKTRTATVVGYMLVIVSVITAEILAANIYKEQRPPWLFWFYPFFVFYRAVYVVWTDCYGAISSNETVSYFACPTSLPLDGELTLAFVVLAVHAVVFLVLAVYLDAVLPTKGFGVPPSHPLLCMHRDKGCGARSHDEAADVEEDLGEKNRILDESVHAEKQRVLQGDASNAAVVISNLCKRFKKQKGRKHVSDAAVHAHLREWAVDHLYLTINQGECFGLLGENGAGKTTAISMLTGLLEVTAGTALFQGYNLRFRRHMQQIHKLIGVCPQFDTLWPSLTPEEHLLFFTRLRGTVPQNKEREHVNELLKLFELDGKRKYKLSKQLSGGMRRRLSVGIALAGDSKIVFLDEPSTGLDPRSRRLLWDIILKFREKGDRSIILTTHSMDEADVLCSRIGIMMRGQLRCVGSSLELKRRFGFGYRLVSDTSVLVRVLMWHQTVSFAPEHKQAAVEEVERLVPSAVSINNYDYTNAVSYQVAEADILHSHALVDELERCKQRGVIHDWELNQTSLEDVFLNVVSRKHNDV